MGDANEDTHILVNVLEASCVPLGVMYVKEEEEEDQEELQEESLVMEVDSSRAASLTRTCRWSGYKKLPDGCELTVGELRDMASRQQQQIETQQQLLVAREQRLKYLKQQESRAAAVAAEAERLRRLKERVELQEAKLRRLRALRGQVEATRLNTASLTTDLDAMRHLFSEKEKELVVAVTKVEELTRQLEELRQGRSPLNPGEQHHNELDKLRRELLYRNSVNREASARVAAQRETLAARREEISRIDKRVSELQQRLHRKRLLNQQLASQITAATQAKQAQLKAVQQKALREGIHSSSSVDDAQTPDHLKQIPRGEDLGEFGPNKSDPKYQTLPYNTKFSVTSKAKETDSGPPTPPIPATTIPQPPDVPQTATTTPSAPTAGGNGGGSAVVTRTVHSIPTHPPSRSLAHAPPTQLPAPPGPPGPPGPPKPPPNPAMTPRVYGPGTQHFPQRTQPLGGAALTQTQKLSPGVTSQSRALLLTSHTPQDVERGGGETGDEGGVGGEGGGRSKPSLPPKPPVPSKPLPPPRQKGDPMATGGSETLTALTPIPGQAQPPARPTSLQARPQHPYRYASQNVIVSTYTQQQASGTSGTGDTQTPDEDTTTTSTTSSATKPPKQPTNNNNNNTDGTEKIHVSINRRIEMPPDFMFPEDETPPSDLLGRRVDEIEAGADVTDRSSSDSVDNLSTPLMSLSELRIDGGKEGEEVDEEVDEELREESRQPDGADTMTLLANEEGHPDNDGDATRRPSLTTNISNTISNILNNNTTVATTNNNNNNNSTGGGVVMRRLKKGNLKTKNSSKVPRRVSFDPLALLLDASLEGELELVKRTAMEVTNPSAANDEGITALHNAICAGHLEIVTFLVTFGCDVNAQDSDGWTPLHCAASCNNVAMVRFLVEHGACILATTLSDHETPAEKCEQDEEGYDGCSQYLYSVQEKLGIMNGGVVYAVYDYEGQAADELSFECGEAITILRRGDEYEREWWWGQHSNLQGYVPRNLLGLYPRVKNPLKDT